MKKQNILLLFFFWITLFPQKINTAQKIKDLFWNAYSYCSQTTPPKPHKPFVFIDHENKESVLPTIINCDNGQSLTRIKWENGEMYDEPISQNRMGELSITVGKERKKVILSKLPLPVISNTPTYPHFQEIPNACHLNRPIFCMLNISGQVSETGLKSFCGIPLPKDYTLIASPNQFPIFPITNGARITALDSSTLRTRLLYYQDGFFIQKTDPSFNPETLMLAHSAFVPDIYGAALLEFNEKVHAGQTKEPQPWTCLPTPELQSWGIQMVKFFGYE